LKRRLIGLFFSIAVLLSLGWWISRLTEPEEVRPTGVGRYPDSYADGLVVSTYDEQGNLKQRLQSQEMQYFEKTGLTELEQPVFWHHNQQAPPLRMWAEQGLIRRSEETLYLPGPVVIDRSAGVNSVPLHIITRELTLRFKDSYANTHGPVRIESEKQWITATGMEAWLEESLRFKLLRDVRGYYEFH
jgi:lipopolysaccharide export system protein LptC